MLCPALIRPYLCTSDPGRSRSPRSPRSRLMDPPRRSGRRRARKTLNVLPSPSAEHVAPRAFLLRAITASFCDLGVHTPVQHYYPCWFRARHWQSRLDSCSERSARGGRSEVRCIVSTDTKICSRCHQLSSNHISQVLCHIPAPRRSRLLELRRLAGPKLRSSATYL